MNNIFADNYNTQELSTQQYFTSTPSQYEDNSYNPNQLLGLGYGDVIMIPTFKVGSTVINTTTEIAPSVFNGGKTIINTVNKIDDDVGRFIQYQKDKLPISDKVKKWTTDNIGYGDINDFYNSSLPPAAAIGGGSSIIYDKGKEIINSIMEEQEKSNEEN